MESDHQLLFNRSARIASVAPGSHSSECSLLEKFGKQKYEMRRNKDLIGPFGAGEGQAGQC